MDHIVDSCPLTLLYGALTRLHEADDDAVNWLKTTATTALDNTVFTLGTGLRQNDSSSRVLSRMS